MLITKLCLCKKKLCPILLEFAKRHVFRLSKITIFEGVFGFFDEGTPYFDSIKAADFR